MRTHRIATAIAGLLLAAPAGAVELADGKLAINGFGGVGVGLTDKNAYDLANPTGTRGAADFSLAVSARPMERLALNTQLHFNLRADIETPAIFDWSFAEWTFNDAARLRIGQAKMPLGIYGELEHVGTLRPFFSLPQGIYGPAEIYTQSYQGVGLTGHVENAAGWGLDYDAFVGNLFVEVHTPFAAIAPETGAEQHLQHFQAAGGRIGLLPPVEGLRLLASGYYGRTTRSEESIALGEPAEDLNPFFVVGGSAEYLRSGFSARAEYFYRGEEGDETVNSGYLELAYFVTEKVQLGARGELSVTSLVDFEGESPLLVHRALGGTINYWFTPGFVVKLSYDNVFGNRFAYPPDVEAAYAEGRLKNRTNVLMAGMQFSY